MIPMRGKLKLCIGIFLLHILTSGTMALADQGYEVGNAPTEGDIVESSGADGNLIFWELPLWIQVSVAVAALASVAAAVKAVPFLLGKITDVLANARRTQVYGYIEGNPGCTVPEISKVSGMSPANVKYHANILEKTKKISSRKFGRYLRLFKNSGAYNDREQMIVSALKSETARAILFAIQNEPGLTNRQLSQMFDISDSTAHWHTERLLNDGILVNRKDGKLIRFYLEKDVESILPKIIKAAG